MTMKNFMIFMILFNTFLIASNTQKEQKTRAEKQLEIEMEKEKKYAKEQTFYKGYDYDLKGAEVNTESLDTVPDLPLDDLDMDSVYD